MMKGIQMRDWREPKSAGLVTEMTLTCLEPARKPRPQPKLDYAPPMRPEQLAGTMWVLISSTAPQTVVASFTAIDLADAKRNAQHILTNGDIPPGYYSIASVESWIVKVAN